MESIGRTALGLFLLLMLVACEREPPTCIDFEAVPIEVELKKPQWDGKNLKIEFYNTSTYSLQPDGMYLLLYEGKKYYQNFVRPDPRNVYPGPNSWGQVVFELPHFRSSPSFLVGHMVCKEWSR
jgi:hypothetical protein